jgi:hypothetical protein
MNNPEEKRAYYRRIFDKADKDKSVSYISYTVRKDQYRNYPLKNFRQNTVEFLKFTGHTGARRTEDVSERSWKRYGGDGRSSSCFRPHLHWFYQL